MKIYSKTIILITLLLATSSQIQAKDNMKHKKQRPNFSSLDINSDGVIDFDEFSSHKIPHAVHQTVFNNIDTDDSGQISEEEFKNHKPPRRKKGKDSKS
jgi:Ca2+-binding EF-hand superfamily protein